MPATYAQKYLQSSTQHYLEIFDISNDLVILKDGSVAMVLQTNAMNFGLLSEEEQDATIYTYAGLLNSLSFPIEIVIRSQKKDVTTYLNYLKSQEQNLSHPLRRAQVKRYREFIETLVQETNILDKKFYVVIPLSAIETGVGNTSPLPTISTNFFSKKKQNTEPSFDKSYLLEKAKVNLEPKRDHLLGQLGRIGLVGRQLKTQELIQLFYAIYNAEAANDQAMADSGAYTTSVVEASMQGLAKQPSLQQFVAQTPSDKSVQDFSAPQQTQPPQPIVQPEPVSPPADVPAPIKTVEPIVQTPIQTTVSPPSTPTPPTPVEIFSAEQ